MKKILFILTLSVLFGQTENVNPMDSTTTSKNNYTEIKRINQNVEYFIRLGGLIISFGGAILAVNNSIEDKNRFKPKEKQTIDTIGYSLISIGGLIIANTHRSNKYINPTISPK